MLRLAVLLLFRDSFISCLTCFVNFIISAHFEMFALLSQSHLWGYNNSHSCDNSSLIFVLVLASISLKAFNFFLFFHSLQINWQHVFFTLYKKNILFLNKECLVIFLFFSISSSVSEKLRYCDCYIIVVVMQEL